MEETHVALAIEKASWDAAQEEKQQEFETATTVIIKGIEIPFLDLVALLVKIALAAIPASIVMAILWGLFLTILRDLFSR